MKATRHLRLTGLMLKRRLDNTTAAAVTELRCLRDHAADERRTQEANQRPGFSLMNCLNALSVATLAFEATNACSLNLSGTPAACCGAE